MAARLLLTKMHARSLTAHGLRFRRRLPGPCCSPTLLADVRVGPAEASWIRAVPESRYAVLPRCDGPATHLNFDGDGNENVNAYQLPRVDKENQMCSFFDPEARQCRLIDTVLGDVRPSQCRSFPVWPQLVVTEFDWFKRGPAVSNGAYVPEPLNLQNETSVQHADGGDHDIGSQNSSTKLSGDDLAFALAQHLAHASGDVEGMSFDEAREALLEHVSVEDVRALRDEVLLPGPGVRRVVYTGPEVTIVDTPHSPNPALEVDHAAAAAAASSNTTWVVRSLHCNDRPALVQTSVLVAVDEEGELRSSLLPRELASGVAPFGDHHQGLALSAAVFEANRRRRQVGKDAQRVRTKAVEQEALESAHISSRSGVCGGGVSGGVSGGGGLRVAVLGAGGCALPLFFLTPPPPPPPNRGLGTDCDHGPASQKGADRKSSLARALPLAASVTAVEASKEVVDAARRFFVPSHLLARAEAAGGESSVGVGEEADSLDHLMPPLALSSSSSSSSSSSRAPVFGAAPTERGQSGRRTRGLELVHSSAQDWLTAHEDLAGAKRYDVVVVDIEDGSSVTSSSLFPAFSASAARPSPPSAVAPPLWCLEQPTLSRMLGLLGPGGVLAVNAIGHEAALQHVEGALRDTATAAAAPLADALHSEVGVPVGSQGVVASRDPSAPPESQEQRRRHRGNKWGLFRVCAPSRSSCAANHRETTPSAGAAAPESELLLRAAPGLSSPSCRSPTQPRTQREFVYFLVGLGEEEINSGNTEGDFRGLLSAVLKSFQHPLLEDGEGWLRNLELLEPR